MAFKPLTQTNRTSNSDRDYTPGIYPTPKAGARRARVSLIVDLGIQEQESLWKIGDKVVAEGTPNAVEQTRKPAQQLAVFADLVNDVVDYGGDIGKQQYRLLLNQSFAGVVRGINFVAVPPTKPDGTRIEGKPWGFPPASLLTKLCKAVDKEYVITEMDVDELLDAQFMADVDVKKTEDKNGKEDKDGNVIVYTNVNFKGASKVANDENDNPVVVAPLKVPAMSISFDSATKEQVKNIRSNLRKKIKLAQNYAGSKMQEAIEAYEAEQAAESGGDTPPVTEKPVQKAEKAKTVTKVVVESDDGSDDSPF